MAVKSLYELLGDVSDIYADIGAHYERMKGDKKGNERRLLACKEVVEHLAVINVEKEILAALQDAYDGFTVINGDRPENGNTSEWDGGVDDLAEGLTEPYYEMLSSEWMAKNTTEVSFHVEERRAQWARRYALEVVKGAMKGVDILAATGITLENLEIVCPGAADPVAVKSDFGAVVEALVAIIEAFGAGYDPLEIYDHLDAVSDPNSSAAPAAATALWPYLDDTQGAYFQGALRAFRLTHSDGVDYLLDALGDLVAGVELVEPPATAPVIDDVPLPGERKKRANKPKPVLVAALEGQGMTLLGLVKAHSALTDKELCEGLGVSRAHVNNIVNGKAEFEPTVDQHNFLRGVVWRCFDGMRQAMSMLDGVEYTISNE